MTQGVKVATRKGMYKVATRIATFKVATSTYTFKVITLTDTFKIAAKTQQTHLRGCTTNNIGKIKKKSLKIDFFFLNRYIVFSLTSSESNSFKSLNFGHEKKGKQLF